MNASLPNFFIIGAAKSGTTTLYEALRQHPDAYMSQVKEPAFFSNPREFARGVGYYGRTYFADVDEQTAIGEATPWYLFVDGCPDRLNVCLSEDSHRFITILRDPTERAYSMYWDQVQGGRESRSFTEVVDRELTARSLPSSQPECVQAYVRCGQYEVFLERYLERFGHDRVLVLLHDDLRSTEDRRGVMTQVASFLGISPEPLFEQPASHNVGRAARSVRFARWLDPPPGGHRPLTRRLVTKLVPRGVGRRVAAFLSRMNRTSNPYPAMPKSEEARLRAYFTPTVAFVESLLGRDLSHWKTGERTENP